MRASASTASVDAGVDRKALDAHLGLAVNVEGTEEAQRRGELLRARDLHRDRLADGERPGGDADLVRLATRAEVDQRCRRLAADGRVASGDGGLLLGLLHVGDD